LKQHFNDRNEKRPDFNSLVNFENRDSSEINVPRQVEKNTTTPRKREIIRPEKISVFYNSQPLAGEKLIYL